MISAIADDEYSLIVADLEDLDEDGLERIDQPLSAHPRTSVVIVKENASAAYLLKAMRVGVRDVIIPDSEDVMATAIGRHVARSQVQIDTRRKKKGRLIAMMPAKGGSGATFLAANLAYVLSTKGNRVALIDMNLQFGDTMLYLTEKHPAANIATLARDAERLDQSLLESSMVRVSDNLWVLGSPESPEE
ncbi:MAG: AAA family ATPase, partial [Quisquiliibacterium sp.]